MNRPQISHHSIQKQHHSYNWQGVMQFLYNEYQHKTQKQNIWALERNSLKQNIKQLEGKILALENINKQLKNKNVILEHSLRQMKIKNHQNKLMKSSDDNKNKQNSDCNIDQIEQLPKVPQRRPKPNKAHLSKMLCSLGIPELLEDIKKDIQHSQAQTSKPSKPQIKKGLQLDLSKMQADSSNSQLQSFKSSTHTEYTQSFTLQGHNDGIRDICFLNSDNQLKQIISVSEDCLMKVWDVQKNNQNQIKKIECVETIRQHTGPIFTCVQGDGLMFTGGMEGIIRAYNTNTKSQKDKKQLLMKWKTNQDDKLQPLWQLLYDKNNKLLISTCSQMVIKAYKIPENQQDKVNLIVKMKPYCKFLYHSSKYQNQDYEQYIPTAVCMSNSSNLVASYFNSNSLVHFDMQTQKIINQLNYKIQGNLSANKLISHPRCLIGAYEDCQIRLFSQTRVIQSFKAHKQAVMSVAINLTHPNSLFSCGQDGYVKLWDIRKLKQTIWETIGHQKKNDQAVHCIQTNFDGVTVSGGADSLVKIYTAKN